MEGRSNFSNGSSCGKFYGVTNNDTYKYFLNPSVQQKGTINLQPTSDGSLWNVGVSIGIFV